MVSLSIIIVNYRSSALILDCLRTMEEFLPPSFAQVIVVDNASGDSSREEILSAFPFVQWVSMETNAGFARANNRGMWKAKGDVLLLLNPDTLCVDDSILKCYQRLMDSTCIAAGVQLLDSEGVKQISGSRFVRGGLNHLLPLPYWGSLIRWLGYASGRKAPGVYEAGDVEEVDWISGAFLMVKKEAVSKAGHMDEDFFLYAEEVEWCSRLRQLGKLCLFGDLRIIHLEGGSINQAHNIKEKGYYHLFDRKGLQLMVSNHVRVRKQYGSVAFLFLLLNYTWAVPFYWACSTLHRLFTLRNPFGEWNKVFLLARHVAMIWKLSSTIIRNKPHFYKML